MADTATDFPALMAQVREGRPEAAQLLFDRYSGHILRVVRRRLDHRLRGKFDSADFLQSVWGSFFAGPVGRGDFAGPEELIAYLARMAQNKVIDEHRRRLDAEMHNVDREQPLGGPAAGDPGPPANAPTPSQFAIADERWSALVAGLPDDQRRALELLRQGCTQHEAAERSGVKRRTLIRLLERLTERGQP